MCSAKFFEIKSPAALITRQAGLTSCFKSYQSYSLSNGFEMPGDGVLSLSDAIVFFSSFVNLSLPSRASIFSASFLLNHFFAFTSAARFWVAFFAVILKDLEGEKRLPKDSRQPARTLRETCEA